MLQTGRDVSARVSRSAPVPIAPAVARTTAEMWWRYRELVRLVSLAKSGNGQFN